MRIGTVKMRVHRVLFSSPNPYRVEGVHNSSPSPNKIMDVSMKFPIVIFFPTTLQSTSVDSVELCQDPLKPYAPLDLYKKGTNPHSYAIGKVMSAFHKCLNDTEDRAGYLLQSIEWWGGWPLVDKCPETNHTLTTLLWRSLNDGLLFIEPARMDIPSTGIYKEPEKFPEQVKAHKDYIYEKISLLRKDLLVKTRLRFYPMRSCAPGDIDRSEIDEMFALERELFQARSPLVRTTISALNLQFPEINFKEVLRYYGAYQQDSNIMAATQYIETLMRLWRTKKRTVVNYVLWKIMRSQYLDKLQLRGQYAVVPEMIAVMNRNKVVNLPIEEGCATVISSFPDMAFYATSALYAKTSVSKEMIAEAKEMSRLLKMSMVDMLQESWMEGSVQKSAVKKLLFMQWNIGYPEWITKNMTDFDHYYNSLKVRPRFSYSQVVEGMARFTIRSEFAPLGIEKQPVDRKRFRFPSQRADANLDRDRNAMEFSAGLLHEPLFGLDYPRAVNYGAIGSKLAREMAHAIDLEGKEYNELGIKENWWDNASLAEYNNRAKCFVDQFNGYRIEDTDLYVDGEKTLSENIADSSIEVALKVTPECLLGDKPLQAYRKYLSTLPNGEEPRVPGLEHLTNEQLFFLSTGSSFCSKNTREDKIERHSWETHSPEKHRVNGMMQNSKEFAKAFNCPAGSKMVRENSCRMFY
uniref:Peptidase_M13_N domain-containing protein n=1 Tax=Steinernema glaseri TaxID=37863 RepID=A0A1I7Z246_9BILA